MDHSEFIEQLDNGLGKEGDIDWYLRRNVLDAGQLDVLARQNLSIPDILNGRYDVAQAAAVEAWQRSVNARLGYKIFVLV